MRPITLNYVQQWPQLSHDPDYGKELEGPTWEFFINRSCSQLLMGLGLQLLAKDDRRSLGPIGIGKPIPIGPRRFRITDQMSIDVKSL